MPESPVYSRKDEELAPFLKAFDRPDVIRADHTAKRITPLWRGGDWEPEVDQIFHGHSTAGRVRRSEKVAYAADVVTSAQVRAVVEQALGGYRQVITRSLVNDLMRRVATLEEAISQKPLTVFVHEVPGYRLASPLAMVVEAIEGGAIARIPELDLWADGFSMGEAIEDAKSMVGDLISELAETPDEQLGPDPRRWKAILMRTVRAGDRSTLRALLLSLGFSLRLRGDQSVFEHPEGALIVLAAAPDGAPVAAHQLASARTTLEQFGMLAADEFDRRVRFAS